MIASCVEGNDRIMGNRVHVKASMENKADSANIPIAEIADFVLVPPFIVCCLFEEYCGSSSSMLEQ